ncbi:MAG: YdeI/OmpD-associated family protein [Ignavibacteriaceae bacterium]|jgi:uncharacterized protein YdeI (YjbR/CyaY-like superfamily)
MQVTKTLYIKERKEWRDWLKKNHKTEKAIWLVYYNKSSGRPRIPYNHAVEEALCFGWIDSTVKKIDKDSHVQRFTPRKKRSQLSELNKERIRRLVKKKKMTSSGLKAVKHLIDPLKKEEFKIAPDILKALKKDKNIWKNFVKFPESYKRIRIGWIEGSRTRPDIFNQRLNYFLKMTAKNKQYGMVK